MEHASLSPPQRHTQAYHRITSHASLSPHNSDACQRITPQRRMPAYHPILDRSPRRPDHPTARCSGLIMRTLAKAEQSAARWKSQQSQVLRRGYHTEAQSRYWLVNYGMVMRRK